MNRRGPAAVFAVAVAAMAAVVAVVASAVESSPSSDGQDTRVPITTTSEPAAGTATTAGDDPHVLHVVPDGSERGDGTAAAPFGSLAQALVALRPGDTLVVGGGTYRERLRDLDITPGERDRPILVRPAEGERPVIEGLLWLEAPSHWTITGVDVTWSDDNDDDEHMVAILGGEGWRLTGAEISGARSFAAVLVGRGARDFRLDHLYVHHTHETNDENQDHLIYVDNGADARGIIERNVLAYSPNGRGVKIGPPDDDRPGTSGLVVRYNTFFGNLGPSNLQVSGSSSRNEIHHNLFVWSSEESVTAFELDGRDNVVRSNLAWRSDGVLEDDDGLVDGGGNVELDPGIEPPEAAAFDDFRPSEPAAAGYGAHAPEPPE